jgi:hypothetical protein
MTTGDIKMTHTINRNKIKNKQDRFNNRSGLYGSHTTDEPQAYTKIKEIKTSMT